MCSKNLVAKMHLQDLQARFANALLNTASDRQIEAHCSSPCLLIASRVAIYRGALEAIWSQTLANAYPVMQKLVGEDFFEILAADYGRQFPSRSGDLNAFGADFSQFLRRENAVVDFPYFADVADLEWGIHCAYYAADASSLTLAGFLRAVGNAAQESQLIFHPAVVLHQSATASAAVWQAHQGDEVAALDMQLNTPSFALVSRRDWLVELQQLEESSYIALAALRDGRSLAVALELALATDASFNVAGALQSWFSLGVFSAYSCKESPPCATNA